MDNLTHTLVGIALAEVLYQRSPSVRRPRVSQRVRKAFWIVSAVAGNLPDLDIAYAGILLPGRLGYLLHHRGHTHTVAVGLLLGAFVGWLAQKWSRHTQPSFASWDLRALWALALAGPVVHLVLDGLNSYGTHPFWPVVNRWFYGDTLFIVEPLVWVSLFPVVYFASAGRRWRWAGEAFVVALLTALVLVPMVKWYSAIGVIALGAGTGLLSRMLPPRARAEFCLGLFLCVVLVFGICSWKARSEVTQRQELVSPSAKLQDLILSPMPANPFCWAVITVETFSNGSRYRLKRGRYSLAPAWIVAGECPVFSSATSTAYLTPVGGNWGSDFEWEGQYVADVQDFKEYADYACGWKAFLRFSRAPFLQEEKEKIWAGDLRYDHEPGLGFSELEVPEDQGLCSEWLPGWVPPLKSIFY